MLTGLKNITVWQGKLHPWSWRNCHPCLAPVILSSPNHQRSLHPLPPSLHTGVNAEWLTIPGSKKTLEGIIFQYSHSLTHTQTKWQLFFLAEVYQTEIFLNRLFPCHIMLIIDPHNNDPEVGQTLRNPLNN